MIERKVKIILAHFLKPVTQGKPFLFLNGPLGKRSLIFLHTGERMEKGHHYEFKQMN